MLLNVIFIVCSASTVFSIGPVFTCYNQCRSLLEDAASSTNNVASIKPLISSRNYAELDAVISAECVIVNRARNCTEECERRMGHHDQHDINEIEISASKKVLCDPKNDRLRKQELRCYITHRTAFVDECGWELLVDYQHLAQTSNVPQAQGLSPLEELDRKCQLQEKAINCINSASSRLCSRDVLRIQARSLQAEAAVLRSYEMSKTSASCDSMMRTIEHTIAKNSCRSLHSLVFIPVALLISLAYQYLFSSY